jgi:hypothetical protein
MEKGRGYCEFMEKANSSVMDAYWREYRNIEFTLAQSKKDLSHEITSNINAAIESVLAEEIMRQIKDVAANAAKTIINNINVRYSTLIPKAA